MGLITVNAKVKLMSEEDFENLEEHEKMGTTPKSQKWVWRSTALHTDDIKRIVAYNSTKSIILGYYDDQVLVKEPFSDVYKKWDENKETNVEFTPDFTSEEPEIEEDED